MYVCLFPALSTTTKNVSCADNSRSPHDILSDPRFIVVILIVVVVFISAVIILTVVLRRRRSELRVRRNPVKRIIILRRVRCHMMRQVWCSFVCGRAQFTTLRYDTWCVCVCRRRQAMTNAVSDHDSRCSFQYMMIMYTLCLPSTPPMTATPPTPTLPPPS